MVCVYGFGEAFNKPPYCRDIFLTSHFIWFISLSYFSMPFCHTLYFPFSPITTFNERFDVMFLLCRVCVTTFSIDNWSDMKCALFCSFLPSGNDGNIRVVKRQPDKFWWSIKGKKLPKSTNFTPSGENTPDKAYIPKTLFTKSHRSHCVLYVKQQRPRPPNFLSDHSENPKMLTI